MSDSRRHKGRKPKKEEPLCAPHSQKRGRGKGREMERADRGRKQRAKHEHKLEKIPFRELSTDEQLAYAKHKLASIAVSRTKLQKKNLSPDELKQRQNLLNSWEAKWKHRKHKVEQYANSNTPPCRCKLPTESIARDISSETSITDSVLTDSTPISSESDELSKECVVCMEEKRNATFVHGDTGHVACCLSCAKAIKESDHPLCPMCNTPIDSVIKHYYA